MSFLQKGVEAPRDGAEPQRLVKRDGSGIELMDADLHAGNAAPGGPCARFAHKRPSNPVAAGMFGHGQIIDFGEPAGGPDRKRGRLADQHRGEPDQMRKSGILGHENGGLRPGDQGFDFAEFARRPLGLDEQVRAPPPVKLVKLVEQLAKLRKIAGGRWPDFKTK